jgi:hypothetical protein
MSLLDKYNAAAAGTNAGNARTVVGVSGVNFFDGNGRNQNNSAPDEFQEGFTPNNAGDYRYGGGGKTPGTYAASSWLDKAVKKVDELFSNAAFNSILKGDVRNAPNTPVHKFTPEAKFQESTALSEFAKAKAL